MTEYPRHCCIFDGSQLPTSIYPCIHSWDARDHDHDQFVTMRDLLMFHVPCFRWQSDQVTGHCTDYLLSLYTWSVTIGTMVIIDTNQVCQQGGRSPTFFVSIITIFTHDTQVVTHDTGVKILMLMTLTLLKMWDVG